MTERGGESTAAYLCDAHGVLVYEGRCPDCLEERRTFRERVWRWSVWTDCTYLVLFGRWTIRVR